MGYGEGEVKIISLFRRDGSVTHARNEVVPGAEWVARGEGVATRMWDGTCVKIEDGSPYVRYDAKDGKPTPADFDSATGWVPAFGPNGAQLHKQLREALINQVDPLVDGTYELCGPKVRNNPEGFESHYLIPHGKHLLHSDPRTFEAIEAFLSSVDIEGIVWHHRDGRMVKIKTSDFAGLKRRRQ